MRLPPCPVTTVSVFGLPVPASPPEGNHARTVASTDHRESLTAISRVVRALAHRPQTQRLDTGSRVSRETYARFYERRGVQLPPPTPRRVRSWSAQGPTAADAWAETASFGTGDQYWRAFTRTCAAVTTNSASTLIHHRLPAAFAELTLAI